ncbi:MAG: carboxypeptidase-like regulatory domain-containing protein [Myxococcota bacterium]
MTRSSWLWAVMATGLAAAGCAPGCGPQEEKEEEEKPSCTAGTTCEDGSICENIYGTSETGCFPPVVVRGTVVNEVDESAIPGADVVALDEDGTPRAGPVTTDSLGQYELKLLVARDHNGEPQQDKVTLRATAQGHETFPSPLRPALPLELSEASLSDGKYVYASDLTRVELTPLEDATGLGRIQGTVVGATFNGGILVTASDANRTPTALTALTDAGGAFTINNVPAGTYVVRGYVVGENLTPASNVVVTPGETVTGVQLSKNDTAVATVSGSVNPVAGGCTGGTSVVLVPRETLQPGITFPLTAVSVIRGEVPRGLRAPSTGEPSISGDWSISGVPDGTYEVLAAYENDPSPCVYDPSNIGGALFIHEQPVPGDGGSRTLSVPAFKVTGAVELVGPGAGDDVQEVTTLTPAFQWEEYSSSKNYQVAVFDSAGRRVWATTVCPDDANGCDTTSPPSVTYGTAGAGTTQPAQAPVLEPGKLYQWRVIALGSRNGASCGFSGMELTGDRECISISEDLRGLFRTPTE